MIQDVRTVEICRSMSRSRTTTSTTCSWSPHRNSFAHWPTRSTGPCSSCSSNEPPPCTRWPERSTAPGARSPTTSTSCSTPGSCASCAPDASGRSRSATTAAWPGPCTSGCLAAPRTSRWCRPSTRCGKRQPSRPPRMRPTSCGASSCAPGSRSRRYAPSGRRSRSLRAGSRRSRAPGTRSTASSPGSIPLTHPPCPTPSTSPRTEVAVGRLPQSSGRIGHRTPEVPMSEDAARRRAEKAESARYHADALRRRGEEESAQAQLLIDRFVARATQSGLATERLAARPWSGRGRYRTNVEGWYLRRDRSVGVGLDGGYYVLVVAPERLGRWRTVPIHPTPPPLQVGKGARDGESVTLEALLEMRLTETDSPRG